MTVADRVFRERRSGWAGADARGNARRVGVALIASAVLHVAATSGVDWSAIFHAEKAEGPPLRARLVPMQPLAPAAEPVAAPRPATRARRAPKLPQAADAVLPPERAVASAEPASTAVPAAAEAPLPERVRAEPTAEPVPAPVVPPPAEPPVAFPERIDLEFNLMKGAGGAPIGRVVHRFERDGTKYLIRSTTEAIGIGALFASGKFVQESQGLITARGLRPERFVVQRGRVERTETAAFDWEGAKATLSAGGATRDWALQPGAQDLLSFIHQLSFLAGEANPPAVWVTTARKFDTVRIEVVGRSTVETDLGPIAAVHFRNQASDHSLRFEVWLAPDYGNLPVKILLRDHRGEEAEQVLANMRIR